MKTPGGHPSARLELFILAAFNVWICTAAAGAHASGICPPQPPEVAPPASALEPDTTDAWPSERSPQIGQSGFLDLQFVHDAVTVDDGIYYLTRLVSPDTVEAYIQHLQDYGTRNSHSPQIIQAGAWLMDQLSSLGYEDVALHPISFGSGSGPVGNVVATKEGLTRPRFRIIVGGHYDSISSQGQGSAPGADDNASGTAATLEIARILSRLDLDATVQYVLFAGEEQGLYGSKDFVDELVAAGVPKDEIFYINMDMIGYAPSHPWNVNISYQRNTRSLAQLMAGVGASYTTLSPRTGPGTGGSDHVSFGKQGYPAIYVYEGVSNPWWHTAYDLLLHLDMDYEAEVVKMVLATVLHLAILAPPPEDIIAFETATGDVLAEWSHSPDADVVGYRVELLDPAGQLVGEVFTRENSATLTPEILAGVSWLRVRSEDVLGEGEPSEAVLVGTGEAVSSIAKPNPASGRLQLEVFIPGSGESVDGRVMIMDASGRMVYSIHDGPLSRGSQTFEWNTTFTGGEAVPSGIYFYVVEADDVGHDSGKVMIVR